MKYLFLLLSFCSLHSFGQENYLEEYQKADSLLQANDIENAYLKFQELESSIPTLDTLYEYTLWYLVATGTQLENEFRMAENFEESLKLGLSTLEKIEIGIDFYEGFPDRKYFLMKNIIVSYFGLGNFEEGKKWKEKLYQAQKENKLPKGLNENFNFDYFTFEGKNIWGYEWFEELPKDRFNSSFSKVVYYVYSTNPDGSDKEQLYRLHVLMFHGENKSFDYLLTKRLETAKNEVSGSLYAYLYNEDIDFAQLQLDIKEVLKGNINPKTRTIISKKIKKE